MHGEHAGAALGLLGGEQEVHTRSVSFLGEQLNINVVYLQLAVISDILQ